MIFNMVGGGNASLNFKVVGGTTEPTNPATNTIWVNTDTEITGWAFSSDNPFTEPSEGTVWFHLGAPSTSENGRVTFNALKKNGIYLTPKTCMQYINGEWQRKEAFAWDGESWIQSCHMQIYFIENGYIDVEAHPFKAVNTEGTDRTYDFANNDSYDGQASIRLPADNGRITTCTFSNVEVPSTATTCIFKCPRLATYDYDPEFALGTAKTTVNRNGAEHMLDVTIVLDVSSVAGTTVDFTLRNEGCADNGYSYISNAWFE